MPRLARLAALLAVLAATGCVIVPTGPLTGPQVAPDATGAGGGAALAPHLPPANLTTPAEGAAAPREGTKAQAPCASPAPGASAAPCASPSPTP